MFNPGDKVMRVGGNTPGVPLFSGFPSGHGPKLGTVYVVQNCWPTNHGMLCGIVGFPIIFNSLGEQCGWPCSAFRKFEEIKKELSQRMAKPSTQEKLCQT